MPEGRGTLTDHQVQPSRAQDIADKAFSFHLQAQPWLKASAYGIYELLANCEDLESGGGSPEQAAKLSPFLALVSPGSEVGEGPG